VRTYPTFLVEANDPVLSLAVSIVGGVSDNINQVLDTSGKVIPSVEFLAKCNTVSDHLGFVVRAVDSIAEVCPLPCKRQLLLRSLFCRSTHTPRLHGV